MTIRHLWLVDLNKDRNISLPEMATEPGRLEQGWSYDEKSPMNETRTLVEETEVLSQKEDIQSLTYPPNSISYHSKNRQIAFIRWLFRFCYIGLAWLVLDVLILPRSSPWVRDSACNWLYTCGFKFQDFDQQWMNVVDAKIKPEDFSNDSRTLSKIPQYVLEYAPLVHLFSEEQFWPCDIAEHLLHITPELNYAPIEEKLQTSNLTNLDELNEYEKGRYVFLTSNDNVEERPDWLGGAKNIPDDFFNGSKKCNSNRCGNLHKQSQGGRSGAPAVLITVDKGNGIVDAFWFYFYSYNLGNIVLNIRWGNHVGDWEHSLIRFQHGQPKLVFFSEHNFGSAYSYDAVEKIGKRPVVYSAVGTHAMYATSGSHPYILPLGLLHDQTDRGPLWDPSLNAHTYTYNPLTDNLQTTTRTPQAPTAWFYFAGHWGDKAYPLNDDRQYGLVGEYHYVNGPLGPRFKNLGRRKVCQGGFEDPCVIKHWIEGEDEVRVWPGVGKGEDWSEDAELRPPET